MEENNWQQRTELLLGEEKMKRIRASHVLVVGLGGVAGTTNAAPTTATEET